MEMVLYNISIVLFFQAALDVLLLICGSFILFVSVRQYFMLKAYIQKEEARGMWISRESDTRFFNTSREGEELEE